MELLPKCKAHRIHVIVLMLMIYGVVQNCAASDGLVLTILHTNDIHSHLEESNKFGGRCFPEDRENSSCYGGVARIVTKVREFKENETNVLFMNGGDFFQGTPYYTLLKSSVISEVMSNMGYDYVCLGNHEFDDGPKNLAPFLKRMNESNITVVGTNTDFSKDPDLKDYNLVKSATKLIDGKKIGILGAVIPDTQFTSNPGPNVEFSDEIESFKKEVINLKNQSVDIIIAITHSGFKREIKIVEEVPEIDVLVGGHTNTFLYNGSDHPKENKPEGLYPRVVERKNGSKALIVQDFWFGKFLGRLKVTFDAQGKVATWEGNPILMDASVPEDPCMNATLEPYKVNMTKQMEKVIGETRVLMEHEYDICRLQECNIGNLVADAYYEYFVNMNMSTPIDNTTTSKIPKAWSEINGAIVNAGSIRTALPSFSKVTWGDVVTTLPYGNSLVVMTINGTIVEKMFEHSVTNYTLDKEARKGRFLQVSGFRVEYDLTKPNGQRVISVSVLCRNCTVPTYEAVNCDATYKIVTADYLTRGGDGFKLLKSANTTDGGPIEYEALEKYVVKMQSLRPPNEGRIKITWNETEREQVENITRIVRKINITEESPEES
uniref:Putative 5' nucleotidase n=1 Tax=Amblyomma cajennense TaxID=34607 RepID=A0A023FPR7_AMBCJ